MKDNKKSKAEKLNSNDAKKKKGGGLLNWVGGMIYTAPKPIGAIR